MQNNNPNDYLQENEMDLKQLFKLLINSKKLIIAITLVITTLGAIYSFQKVPQYHSTALVEIGSYRLDEYNQMTIEHAEDLATELNINFVIKQLKLGLVINAIEDKLIQIAYTSSSSETNKNLINKITRYIENRHSLLLSNYTQKTKNQLTYKIEQLNDQIEYSNNISLTKNVDEKLRISNLIERLNSQLPNLDRKIETLNGIIVADTRNLLLLKSTPELLIKRAALTPTLDQVIFSYRSDIIDYENEKIKLSQEKR